MIFKKPIVHKDFEKKFLKRIYVEKDKEFFKNCFVEQGENYIEKGDLSKEDSKRLKKLVKEIKANRGSVQFSRLIIAAVVIGGIVLFSFLFKDKLIKDVTEAALSTAFSRPTTVESVEFDLLGGNIGLQGVQVGPTGSELFSFQEASGSVSVNDLIEGRGIIHSLVISDFQWYGRSYAAGSGAVSGIAEDSQESAGGDAGETAVTSVSNDASPEDETLSAAPAAPEAPAIDLGPLTDIQENAQKAVMENLDKFESYNRIMDGKKELEADYEHYVRQVEKVGADFEEVSSDFDSILANPVDYLVDLDKAKGLQAKYENKLGEYEEIFKEYENLDQKFNGWVAKQQNLMNSAYQGFEKDIATLQNFVEEPSLEKVEFLASFLVPELYKQYDEYKGYAETAQKVLAAFSSDKEPEPDVIADVGRTVSFAEDKPAFLIENITIDGQGYKIEAGNITSEPAEFGSVKIETAVNGVAVQGEINPVNGSLAINIASEPASIEFPFGDDILVVNYRSDGLVNGIPGSALTADLDLFLDIQYPDTEGVMDFVYNSLEKRLSSTSISVDLKDQNGTPEVNLRSEIENEINGVIDGLQDDLLNALNEQVKIEAEKLLGESIGFIEIMESDNPLEDIGMAVAKDEYTKLKQSYDTLVEGIEKLEKLSSINSVEDLKDLSVDDVKDLAEGVDDVGSALEGAGDALEGVEDIIPDNIQLPSFGF